MRILRVIGSMNPSSGGPCQGIRNSITELSRMGIENEVVCLNDPSDSFVGTDAFTLHALGPKRNSWSYSPKLLPWLMANLERFDIVIVHGLWLYPSYATAKAFKILRKKKVASIPKLYIMPHGMLDPWFQRAEGRRLKAIRNSFYWRLIERKIINNADGVLFTCQQELNLAKETFDGYHPRKELNVSYGIGTPPPYTTELTTSFKNSYDLANEKYILFLSRIHQKKGIDILIEAYIQLERQGVKLPLLLVAGPHESEYAADMIQLANKSPNIRFVGMLLGSAKWGAIYGSECFILPSHQENFGISVVEALACGKPVLISNQVNIWREIEKGGAGLIASDDLDGAKKMLSGFLEKSDYDKLLMSANALKVFNENFTIASATNKLVSEIIN